MNGGVDVDRVYFGIFEEIFEVAVAFFDFEGVADLIELVPRTLADGVHAGVGVPLINGNEFSSKTEANYGDVYFAVTHRSQFLRNR